MPAFVVHLNGNRVCSLRLTDNNTATIDIAWIGGQKKDEEGLVFFHIGSTEGSENLRWSAPQLEVGDEVTIRITGRFLLVIRQHLYVCGSERRGRPIV